MKCTKCNAEMDDDLNYCRNCGNKLNQDYSKSCPKCGKSIKSDNSFCTNCGYKFTNENNVSDIPLYLGVFGSLLGFIFNFYIVNKMYYVAYLNTYALNFNLWLNSNSWALLIFIPPLIGFISTLYLLKDRRFGAIGMIISAVLFFLCILIGWIPGFLVGLGGLLVLLKR